jgi:xylan 1,4-beta-xylosidase
MAEPLMAGFYPDPTICRAGEDYYLAHSSFEYFPGVPLWHSRNLQEWRQIGHILTRRSQFVRGDGSGSGGIYAGTLRHHGGRFFYVTTNVSDFDAGQLIVQADDPTGRWSDAVHIPGAVGIDPDLAWDGAGTCYLTWKAMSPAISEIGILQSRINPKTGQLLDPPYPVWQGSGLGAAEGPHLYHHDGCWYLLLAEGGTERGHAVTIARGLSPVGPFAGCPSNPILTHRSSLHPIQSAGHADLVSTADGGWAAVYLGTRPHGSTPGFHVLGRETFLAGIDWRDGWPVFDEDRYTVTAPDMGFVDNFTGPGLHQRWVMPGGDPAATVKPATAGGIELLPATGSRSDHELDAGLLCTRIRDLRWSAEVTLDGPGRFGLRLDHRHHYSLLRHGSRVDAIARIGDLDTVVGTVPVGAGPVALGIEAADPAVRPGLFANAGPDQIVLSVHSPTGRYDLARLDGRYLSTEVATGFTGRMLALGATTVPATIRQVIYRPARRQTTQRT